ncbi:glycosyltransferase family 25 protein [Consotaella aegiceratis]|uniref:glycosyltransferase family 25 protein n=1 Tax=Consotaella aegiceratis TaxID=3097961 RepID=UPI002F4183EA
MSSSKSAPIVFYVINLDRSSDRLGAIEADASRSGITLIRVPAIEGKMVPEQTRRTLLDERGFKQWHGKRPMPGEYGCYASHLKALEQFLDHGAPFAAILEDDAHFGPELLPHIDEILSTDDWDVVKLYHHRNPLIRPIRKIGVRHRLGIGTWGPTGSGAGYLVNRKAAERLIDGLRPMRLPYDVALERGWAFGLRVRAVWPNLIKTNPRTRASILDGGIKYSSMKLKPWQRLPTLAFRTRDLAHRLLYAMAGGGS